LAYQPQSTVLFSQNKPATINQPAVLFSQNKSASAINHQPNEQAGYVLFPPASSLSPNHGTPKALFNLLKILTFSSLYLHRITVNTPKDICSEY
jgi:hypothetical protein